MGKKHLVLAVGALLLAGAGHAADAVIKQVKGEVLVKTGGADSFYRARQGDPLYFWDQVKTGEGAMVHIAFNDGATILVKEKAALTLRGGRKDAWVAFDVGEFLIGLKKKLAGGDKFRVKTPAAAASVRGTLFWGLSDEKKDSAYACFADAIEIQAGGKTLVLEAGQKVKIPFGRAPDAAEKADVPLSYLDTFAVDGSIQGLADLIPKEDPAAP